RLLAALFGFLLVRTHHAGWLAPYATFEFGFVIVLISAARAGFASSLKEWRTVLRLIAILPIFVAIVWAMGQISGLETFQGTNGAVLGCVYLYNFFMLRKTSGVGARIFRYSLLVLAAAFFEAAGIFLYLFHRGTEPQWVTYLHH